MGGWLGSCWAVQVKHSESGGGSEQTQHKYILWEDCLGLEDGLVEMSERETSGPWPEQPVFTQWLSSAVPHILNTFQRLRSKLFRAPFW